MKTDHNLMNNIIRDLFILQELELNGASHGRGTSKEERQVKSLRKNVPENLLDLFDRWIDRGKKPIAMVRHGICCECHLKVASGVLVNLAHHDEIEHCGNCGRILYFMAEEDCTARHSRSPLKPSPRGKRLARELTAFQQSIQMVE